MTTKVDSPQSFPLQKTHLNGKEYYIAKIEDKEFYVRFYYKGNATSKEDSPLSFSETEIAIRKIQKLFEGLSTDSTFCKISNLKHAILDLTIKNITYQTVANPADQIFECSSILTAERCNRLNEILSDNSPLLDGGLPNLGNTCFGNAVLQAFFRSGSGYIAALVEKAKETFLKEMNQDSDELKRKKRIRSRLLRLHHLQQKASEQHLRSFLRNLWNDLTPFLLTNDRKTKLMKNQGDPHELFLTFLEVLDLEKDPNLCFNEYQNTNNTLVRQGSPSLLILKAPLASYSATSNSLQIILEGYFAKRPSDDNQLVQLQQYFITKKPPSSFTFVIPRFRKNTTTNALEKDASEILINEKINIPYYENKDKITNPSDKKIHTLTLRSVICHKEPGITSGHYYAMVKEGDKWFKYDDAVKETINDPTDLIKKEGYLASYGTSDQVHS